MCGIAGFLGSFDPGHLGAMNRIIAHRGPDGDGVWHDPKSGVGLSHRRLAIIDLSARGLQPMWDASRRAVISFNGEIYNYRELRAELDSNGIQFNSDTDTEVILNLYLRDGLSCISRLNGIFAFALWDTRREELIVARDSMGVKPLYVAETPSGFAFASELKALLPLRDVDRRLDFVALKCYLTYLYSPGTRTMFSGVRKLGPGECLVVRRGEAPRRHVFRTGPYDQPLSAMSADEAVAQVRYFLSRAVDRQMVADVQVGAFLSGGLDSSSIVNFARQSNGVAPLECFTIGFERTNGSNEGLVEDLPYAREVAEHLGVPLSTVWVAPDMSAHFERMIWHLDEPQADPAALNVFFIAQLAREKGVKVLLSGAGGDDIFSGYRRHQALLGERYWSWLPRDVRRMMQWASERPSKASPIGRRLSKALQFADESAQRRLAGYFVWLRSDLLDGLLSPAVREEIADWDVLEPLLEENSQLPDRTPALNRMLNLDTRFFLADHNLNYTDKMSMATGVEVRVPFLDPDLVGLAARMPLEFKQRGAVGKWVLKEAMKHHLPEGVINRPKAGFGVPLREWMGGELGRTLRELLSPEAINRRGLFDAQGVRSLIEQDRAGRIDAAYPIFALACVEMWCRQFLDVNNP